MDCSWYGLGWGSKYVGGRKEGKGRGGGLRGHLGLELELGNGN